MPALSVYQGIETALRSLDYFQSIMLGEPTGSIETPAIYTVFLRMEIEGRSVPPARNLDSTVYIFIHRIVIQFVDNAAAEMQLLSLIDAIPDAIYADPRLGGALAIGIAQIPSGDAGFIRVGDVLYRVFDIEGRYREKRSAT